MQDLITNLSSQTFGVAGAVAVLAAVTMMNMQRLRDHVATGFGLERVVNGLNLVGGICWLAFAVLRNEVVWLVLATYFVAIALKGVVVPTGNGAVRTAETARTEAVIAIRVPRARNRALKSAIGLTGVAVMASVAMLAMATRPSVVQVAAERTVLSPGDEVLSQSIEAYSVELSEACPA